MAARRRRTQARRTSSSKTNKDLFVFVIILVIVAVITYVLTYNAIMGKLDQYTMPSTSTVDYQLPAQVGQ